MEKRAAKIDCQELEWMKQKVQNLETDLMTYDLRMKELKDNLRNLMIQMGLEFE